MTGGGAHYLTQEEGSSLPLPLLPSLTMHPIVLVSLLAGVALSCDLTNVPEGSKDLAEKVCTLEVPLFPFIFTIVT